MTPPARCVFSVIVSTAALLSACSAPTPAPSAVDPQPTAAELYPDARTSIARMAADARLPKAVAPMREAIGVATHHAGFPLDGEFGYRAAIEASGYPAVIAGREALEGIEAAPEARLALALLSEYLAGDVLLRRYAEALKAGDQERATDDWDALISHTESMRSAEEPAFVAYAEAFEVRAQALRDRFED